MRGVFYKPIVNKERALKRNLLSFILPILFLLGHLHSYAWDFSNSSNIRSFSIDKSQRKISFEILFHRKSSNGDENIEECYVSINNTSVLSIYSVEHHGGGGGDFLDVGSGGSNEDEFRIYTHSGYQSHFQVIEAEVGGKTSKYVKCTLTIPQQYSYLDNYKVKFSGEFQDDDDDTEINRSQDQSGWSAPTTTNVTTTTDICGQVNLSWTKNNAQYYFEVQSKFVGEPETSWSSWSSAFANANYTDYFENSAQDPNHEKKYKVKVGWGPYMRQSKIGSEFIGKIPSIFDAPANVEPTLDNCDSTITLSWDWAGSNPKGFRVQLYNEGEWKVVSDLEGNARSYIFKQDSVGLLMPNEFYPIRIAAKNKCEIIGEWEEVDGKWMDTPDVPTNFAIKDTTIGGERVMYLSWDDNAINEARYVLKKTLFGGATSEYLYLNENDTFYIDNNTAICNKYLYELYAQNVCTGNIDGDGIEAAEGEIEKVLTFDLSETFLSDEKIEGSKGYYPDRTEITWSTENNLNLLESFKVYRKLLGSGQNYTQIGDVSSGTQLFLDETANAGSLYEYMVIGEAQCLTETLYTDTVRNIGFRSPTAIVNGQITYTGGVAVEGVKVLFEAASNSGKSVEFEGSSYLEVGNDFKNPNNNQSFYIENWLKTNDQNFTLFSKSGVFELSYLNGAFTFVAGNSTQTFNVELSQNQWQYIGFGYENDSIKLYKNGIVQETHFFNETIDLTDHTNLRIGENLVGFYDELRVWNVLPTPELIERDYSRFIVGDETGLITYLRFDELVGEFSYDLSHEGILYNKNNAEFINNVLRSSEKPFGSQLTYAAYTDSLGSYSAVIPYSGVGQNFTLTPSFETHQFSPATTALFLGDGANVNNGVNFEDISSFPITGELFYEGTSCPVEDATVLVDNKVVVKNGNPVKTDANGLFSVNVPIGDHFISIDKKNHTFSAGRFPQNGDFNFQEPISGIEFWDDTKVKIIGRVTGGNREASRIQGFGKTKNNIGVAELIFETTTGGGCFVDTFYTDSLTGEYVALLPPLTYIEKVKIPSNLAVDFGVLDQLDYVEVPSVEHNYDSTFSVIDHSLIGVDSVGYHHILNHDYSIDPEIFVFGKDGESAFGGDTSLIYSNGHDFDTLNLVSSPTKHPVFSKSQSEEFYKAVVKVFETYVNKDSGSDVLDSVPTTTGQLVFKNELASFASLNETDTVKYPKINMNEVNTVDSLLNLVYSFQVGIPNFLENTSIPEYSFTKVFEINYTKDDGTVVLWEPIQSGIPTGGDKFFRGYVLGNVFSGNQFVTEGPQMPEYVLRDPPGSNSSSFREVGKSSTVTNSWSSTSGNSTSAEDKITVGVEAQVGWWGYYTTLEVGASVSNGIETSMSGTRSGEVSTTVSNSQAWATSGDPDLVGKDGDLYVGRSQNVQFGITQELSIVPTTIDTSFEVLGTGISTSGIQMSMIKNKNLSIIPKGYSTNFIYTERHIKETLIPNLEILRNSFLVNNPAYVSNLNVSHENYGKNNDDKVFGANASTQTPNIEDSEDATGVSYTFTNPIPNAIGDVDSVRYFNKQIIKWQEAIALNEWEKVNINNPTVIDSVMNAELEKLEEKYIDYIEAYEALSADASSNFQIAKIASIVPIPGSSIVGRVAFEKTKSAGVKEADVYGEYSKYQQEKERILNKFSGLEVTNYSISGGAEYSSSMSQERVASTSTSIEYSMSAALASEVSVNVGGAGFEMSRSYSVDYSSSKDWSRESGESETVGYTLSEDDGDYMSVDVHQSILGWGPIFKRKPGGVSSCPYEGDIVTEFYQPGTIISDASQQSHMPVLSVSPSILTNIPIADAAVYNLNPGNNAQDESDQTYNVRVLTESNPFGAIVKIDGLNPNIAIDVPYGTSINKVLTIEKGPGSVYNYDSIAIVFESPCESSIADTVFVSAHFLPECTPVHLITPEDQWVVNNGNENLLDVVVSGYNINHFDFERLWIQYKPTNQSTWIGLESFWKDTIPANQDLPIPRNTSYTPFGWNVKDLTDGNYDIKIVSECTLSDANSPIYSGVIDRVNPHAFGSPSPADGILSAEDEISITFNEDIESGSLSQKNFDIRGVLNGSEIRHQVSAEFDGSSSYVEIPSGLNLQTRDFTVEFWLKNGNYNDAIFFSQGPGSQEGIKIGAENSGKIYFEIDGERVRTDGNVANSNKWHHYAFAYNYSNETVEIFVDGSLRNTSNINIYSDYIGSGKIWIGKGTFGSPDHFEGNIHDLRVWNHTRSLPQVVSHMNVQVGKQNLGLLHNWKMDEATGTTITDHVRLRNGLLKDTEWALNPGGYAMTFDTVNAEGYTLSSANVSFTDEMDFTLEFWYNGTSTSRETLFSNGKGDGIGADSISSMSLTKYEDGSLHLLHFGQDIVVAETGSFDGNWHHIAIVIDRTSVVSSYLDGNLSSTTLASSFKEFGSSQFAIGARYFQNGAIKEYDEHFTGSVDEFRIWSLARSQTQINRDMRYKLQGDELGLVSYIPFEHYEKELGVFILKENYTDQADTSHHELYSENSLSGSSPKIKLPRPVEKVNFTYSVNGDKIILTPTSPKAKIENTSLDVTVKDVLDLHGNSMQSPATWIAFPDQNQIVWETELVTIDILKDEGYSFTKKIVNSGGSAKNFTIENIPSWLTTSVIEGLIEPGSTFEVTFTVVEEVNIGSYKEDIIVMTDFNYPERLTVDLKVRGTTPNWDVNPGDFEKSMSVIGSIGINDVVSIDPEDVLYVFINDECRGKANLQYISSTDRFVAFLDVYSNSSAADTLEFKIWDASTGSIFVDVTPDDITFVTDGLEGSLLNPQQFDAYSKVQENYALQPGWNWVSFHLGTTDTLHLATLLSSLELQDGDQIKTLGNNTFATYSTTYGWLGNLRNTGVNLAKGYKIKLSNADTLVNIGDVVDPASYNVNLQTGWNWIGFVSIRPMNTNVALGNLEPTTGDLIKGRSNFSVYDEQLGWIGSLNTMYPNQSYMYNSLNAQATNFTFPVAGGFKMASSTPYSELTDVRWPVNYGKSISNMSAVVELEQCENPINLDEWYIGFFDGTGTCRSLSVLEQINDEKQLAFVTAVGNDDLSLTPKLLNKVTGEELVLEGGLSYQANSHKGNYETPIVVSLKAEDCLKFTQPTPEEEIEVVGEISVYPIEFNASFTVEYTSLINEALTLELVNAQGQVVIQLEQQVQIGANKFEVNKQLSNLSTGVYVLRINQTKQTNLFKLVKHR